MSRPADPVRLRAARDVPRRGCARSRLKQRSTRPSIAVVARRAASVVIVSRARGRRRRMLRDYLANAIVVRGHGFPDPERCLCATGTLRAAHRRFGRTAPDRALRRPHRVRQGHRAPPRGRAPRCRELHVVLDGPDDRHGTMASSAPLSPPRRPPAASTLLGAERRARRSICTGEADVFVLASAGDSFGLVAAEAAAAGTARRRHRSRRGRGLLRGRRGARRPRTTGRPSSTRSRVSGRAGARKRSSPRVAERQRVGSRGST